MKAVILAAGRGSRMKGLTEAQPKCLLQIDGKALLELQIESLLAAGIAHIGIVVGYKKELLSGRGLTEFHNARWQETNMVSSLECADSWLSNGPCIVSYSDIFYQPSAVRNLINSAAPLAVTYDKNWRQLWEKRFGDPLLDAETFKLNANSEVIEIGQKPSSLEEIQGQYMGLLRFTPESWAEVKRIRSHLSDQQCDSTHMTGTLQLVINAGNCAISAIEYCDQWGEVDCENDLMFFRDLSSEHLK
jgi:choline kinase